MNRLAEFKLATVYSTAGGMRPFKRSKGVKPVRRNGKKGGAL